MEVEYIVQPDQQLGRIVLQNLGTLSKRTIFVSAFVDLQTIIRMKHPLLELRSAGSVIRFVVGIDMNGTSQEVLRELLSWNVDVRIVKFRTPGHTFHPKLYLFETDTNAEIIVGSNNITEGGFFNNYEGAVKITYNLPIDANEYQTACDTIKRFIDPEGPTVRTLTIDLLNELIVRNDIPTEAEARKARSVEAGRSDRNGKERRGREPLFGTEYIELPPPLPAELLEGLIRNIRNNRKRATPTAPQAQQELSGGLPLPVAGTTSDEIMPAAFYMTLPTLQGDTIPGEARIPLEAIELARDFWGWPDEYVRVESPRAGNRRVYWNWRPVWRVWSVEHSSNIASQQVRMYMYENSSDFRFYVRPLVNAGGDLGDIVRIRRIAQPDAEFECVLARQRTPEYQDWIGYCTQSVRNSTRLFGYA